MKPEEFDDNYDEASHEDAPELCFDDDEDNPCDEVLFCCNSCDEEWYGPESTYQCPFCGEEDEVEEV